MNGTILRETLQAILPVEVINDLPLTTTWPAGMAWWSETASRTCLRWSSHWCSPTASVSGWVLQRPDLTRLLVTA